MPEHYFFLRLDFFNIILQLCENHSHHENTIFKINWSYNHGSVDQHSIICPGDNR